MKEIVQYAFVDKNGIVLTTMSNRDSALCSLYYIEGRTIVKLTGQMPEPKKPRMLAPALLVNAFRVELSKCLYASEEEAIDAIGKDLFHSWPAVPNADGFYSLVEE